MYDHRHLDEKVRIEVLRQYNCSFCSSFSQLFKTFKVVLYIYKLRTGYYLHPKEEVPNKKFVLKWFVKKVMFVAAVGRPHFDYNKGSWVDNSIGIWDFAEDKVAK